jgi:hypothetical protein
MSLNNRNGVLHQERTVNVRTLGLVKVALDGVAVSSLKKTGHRVVTEIEGGSVIMARKGDKSNKPVRGGVRVIA